MSDDHNGEKATGLLVIALTVVFSLGIVGIVAILIAEEHPEHAAIYCGIVATAILSASTAIISAANRNELRQVRIQTNSRMDQLIDQVRIISEAKGHRDERSDVAAAAAEQTP